MSTGSRSGSFSILVTRYYGQEVAQRREKEADYDRTNIYIGLPRHANASGQSPVQTVTEVLLFFFNSKNIFRRVIKLLF